MTRIKMIFIVHSMMDQTQATLGTTRQHHCWGFLVLLRITPTRADADGFYLLQLGGPVHAPRCCEHCRGRRPHPRPCQLLYAILLKKYPCQYIGSSSCDMILKESIPSSSSTWWYSFDHSKIAIIMICYVKKAMLLWATNKEVIGQRHLNSSWCALLVRTSTVLPSSFSYRSPVAAHNVICASFLGSRLHSI